MKEVIELVFDNYWNHLLIIGGIVYYFIKSYRDFEYKKNEVNHSLFQEKRIEIFNYSIKSISNVYYKINVTNYAKLFDGNSLTDWYSEIDELKIEMTSNLFMLKAYMNKIHHQKITQILHEFDDFEQEVHCHFYFPEIDSVDERLVLISSLKDKLIKNVFKIVDELFQSFNEFY